MTVESKIIVTAEDRTRAAFASMERNSKHASNALARLTGTALKLAGAGTVLNFFRNGAESTERWRDELAKLNDVTEEFFKIAADSGKLNPLIGTIKTIQFGLLGASVAVDNLAKGVGAILAAQLAAMKLNFSEARRALQEFGADARENSKYLKKLYHDITTEAPKGFAKQEEAAKKAAEAAQRLTEQRDRDRIKQSIDNARAAEDALRAEGEISEGSTGAGLTLVGEDVYNEARAKEQERADVAAEKQRQRLQQQIEIMNESFMTENEQAAMQYETQQMMLDDAFMREFLSAEDHTRQKEELELQHQAKMGNITAQGVLARRKFEEMNAKQKTSFVLSEMLALTAGVAGHNKTLFKLNRGLAIANLAVEAPAAIGSAIARGGGLPWGAGFGILTALKFVALAAAAKKADFGTSTSAPSIGGGSAIPTYDASTVPSLSAEQAAPLARNINVVVESDSGMVSTEWVRDKLFPSINDALGDGVTLNVARA